MPLPILAMMGLGFGAKIASDEWDQNKANKIWGTAPTYGGPTQPGQQPGLMDPGTGLMGGQMSGFEAATKLLPLGGNYADLAKATLASYMGYKAPRNAQIIQSGVKGNPKQQVPKMLVDGQAVDIPGAIARETGSTNINIGTEGGYRLLTPKELVNLGMRKGAYQDSKGKIYNGPAPAATEGEAKQAGQGEIANLMMDEIQTLLDSGELDPSDPLTWARSKGSTIPILSKFIDMTPKEAKAHSNIEGLSNLVLAMIRGAQVGPEEQKLFDRQLPKLGQDKEVFAQNLANTKRNIATMLIKMHELRNIGEAPITRKPGDIWEEGDYDYRMNPDGSISRRKK